MTEEIPSGGEITTGVAETATSGVSEVATVVPEKCILQCVLTAVLRPRFLSSQQKDGRFTAGNAFLTTGNSKFEYSLMGVVL